MKRCIFLLFVGLFAITIHASSRIHTGGIVIPLPNEYRQVKSESFDVTAYDTVTNNWFISSKLSIKKYDRSKLFKSMDTLMYNIREYELADSDTEWFFQWGKDYEKRFYLPKKEGEKKVVTYTFADIDYCYSLYFQYETDEELSAISDAIDKININMGFWESYLYLFACSPVYWIFYLLFILSIGAAIYSDGISGLIGLMVAACAILVLTLWGEWLWVVQTCALIVVLIAISPIALPILKAFGDD